MSVAYRIAGYDKSSEKIAYAFDVPSDRLAEVRGIVKAPASQEESFGSLPLQSEDAWKVAWRLHLPMNVDHCDWFFEPFDATGEITSR